MLPGPPEKWRVLRSSLRNAAIHRGQNLLESMTEVSGIGHSGERFCTYAVATNHPRSKRKLARVLGGTARQQETYRPGQAQVAVGALRPPCNAVCPHTGVRIGAVVDAVSVSFLGSHRLGESCRGNGGSAPRQAGAGAARRRHTIDFAGRDSC